MFCEIRIKGRLSPDWAEWLGGLTITNSESGEALLSGQLADQAALFGVLNRIHAMNLPLLSLTCRAEDSATSLSART